MEDEKYISPLIKYIINYGIDISVKEINKKKNKDIFFDFVVKPILLWIYPFIMLIIFLLLIIIILLFYTINSKPYIYGPSCI